MRIMVTASIIAISSALSANASTIFAGPGPVSITDADVALGIAIDAFSFNTPGSISWSFTNNSSTALNFFGALANGLSISANGADAIASLEAVTVGFVTATETFDTPFVQNPPSYSGSVALGNVTGLAIGETIDLVFEAGAINAPLQVGYSFAVAPIPLPAGLPLLGAGLGVLALMRRKATA